MKRLSYLAFAATVLTATFAQADEEYNHFPAVKSATTAQALDNLAEYNKKLAEILAKTELSAEDMVKVHELTYTLENALARIQASLETTADNLEIVHKASERLDQAVVKGTGKVYFDATTELVDSCRVTK